MNDIPKIGKKGVKVESEIDADVGLVFKVSFKVDDKVLDFDINRKLHIPSVDILTPAKVANLMAENPSIHTRWNVLSNNAAIEYDKEKMGFDIWEKAQSKTYRKELIEVSGKRVTDKMVEEAVMTDPEYMKRYSKVLQKKQDAANIKSIALGFGERGDRLVNISSLMKSEKPTTYTKPDEDSRFDDKRAFRDDDE